MSKTKWMTSVGATAPSLSILALSILALSVLALSMLGSGCTEPRGELAGCTTDSQCKGVRVCSPEGQCVSPLALPSPDAGGGGGDASSPDVSSPDASFPDASNDADPSRDGDRDTSTPSECDRAPTARMSASTPGSSATTTLTVAPGATIELDGSQSTAAQGRIDSYEWSVVDFPYAGDLPHLAPPLTRRNNGRASFAANTLGNYTIELTVIDDAGNESCNTARVDVTAATDADIFVELVWETLSDPDQTDDDGTDLDLHYKHPDGDWGFEPLDIFWYNPTADWGDEGESRDDPELIRDDEDGAGPESIAHDRPDDLPYQVGIYYYDDYGFGESKATIRVYLDGNLAHEVSAEPMSGTDTFYEAVTIDADEETVASDDVHYDGYPPLD